MGPSGNAAYRLSCAMRKAGVDSSVLTMYHCSTYEHVYYHSEDNNSFLRKVINRIIFNVKMIGKKPESIYYRILPTISRKIWENPQVNKADVIYIHWIAGVLSEKDFEGVAKSGKPIVFFMHDMWDFTGGCHYSFGCTQYNIDCSRCPMFSFNHKTPQKQIMQLKKIYSKFNNIAFVSPSLWMEKCAKNSIALKGKHITSIPNVIDESIFKRSNKIEAKKALKLPLNKKIITFGCQSGTNNKIKGWIYLKEAIDKIIREDIHVVIYGSGENEETKKQIKYPITFLGHITKEETLALICNATDVFVSPSISESFGLTLLENILCGTPVVAFNNTAIGEIVKTGESGYLANNEDSEDLAYCINYILDNNLTINTSIEYSSENIVKKHLDLIEKITENAIRS